MILWEAYNAITTKENEYKKDDKEKKEKEAENENSAFDKKCYQPPENMMLKLDPFSDDSVMQQLQTLAYCQSPIENSGINSRKLPEIDLKNPSKINFSKNELAKIDKISTEIGCNPEDLKAVFYVESGGKTDAVNKKTNATGLIQFLPSTAKWLGTSTEELKKMSAEKQLDYVNEYFKRAKKIAGFKSGDKLNSESLYCLVICPSKAKSESLYKKGSLAYTQNKSLDKNRDGIIAKTEVGQRLDRYYA